MSVLECIICLLTQSVLTASMVTTVPRHVPLDVFHLPVIGKPACVNEVGKVTTVNLAGRPGLNIGVTVSNNS